MADTNRVETETFVASGDLSVMQHRFVDHVGVGIIGHSLARGGMGVLVNKPQSGEHATVAFKGRVRVDAGLSVTAGDWIVSAASGFGIPQVLTNFQTGSAGAFAQWRNIMGRAMTTAASGSVFTIELDVKPTLVMSA